MGKMKFTKSKLFESENAGLLEARLNVFIGRINPKDIIEVGYAGNKDSYSALVVYKYNPDKPIV